MPAGGDGPAAHEPVMASESTSWAWRLGEASATPRHPVTQRDRSCAGRTTERGTEACLTAAARQSLLTWHASVPRPITRGSGEIGSSAWSCHGAERLA